MFGEGALGWLAGLFDGEGCLTSQWISGRFRLRWCISMTHEKTIAAACSVLRRLGIAYSTTSQKRTGTQRLFYVNVTKRAALFKLIWLLYPYCVTKKEHLGVVFDFLERNQTGSRAEYTCEDRMIPARLSALNSAKGNRKGEDT